ncbi:hypothetical protein [Haliangium ochraceum]|uniref:Uncharacterized protein n=1 Tax=Haliangium ochraceum (strain DSM 14365 / JCM 11303 / SMP-2) TaxID=502025 RepID=D0LJZ9_HALO1|nr:hypothetical protein [Haliangium ochraceum]ACY18506.1 hypothetical protein Hoch_6031 [Haliangium ochraceum DSM 14365]
MKRFRLVALVLGVLGIAGLVALWRMSGSEPAAPATSGAPVVAAEGEPRRRAASHERPVLPDVPEPRSARTRAAGDTAEAQQGGAQANGAALGATLERAPRTRSSADLPEPHVYLRDDGVLIRDYRNPASRSEITATFERPRTLTRVTTDTVVTLRDALRPIVNECTKDLENTSLGDEPRLQTTVLVSAAAGGALTVDDTLVSAVGIEEPALPAVRDCIIAGAAPLRLSIDEPEPLSRYPMTMVFAFAR